MKYLKVAEIMGRGRKCALSALMLLAILAPCAQAALKYDVDAYVQDGLVLHLDGIRNAGANAPHDANAEKWVDLSSTGNSATLKSNGVTTYGTSGWTDNGYMFYRNAWFLTDRAQSFEGDDGDFTIQAVVDFSQSAANLVSWPMVFDSSDGTTTIQAYWNNTSGQKKAYLLADKYTGASGGNTSGRPYLTSAWAGHYLTAAFATASGGGKDAWLFEGTTYPTAHPGYVKGGSSSTALNAQWAFGSIVSDSGRDDRLFTGKILSIRAYSHKLSEAELAKNRAIDEARFITGIPVTNAVIATTLAGATGPEGTGSFAVDEYGYTFRAPACATVGGVAYALSGCTVASWDDATGNWGAAETRDGVFAVAVSSSDKVKITWQWKAATGSLDAGYLTKDLALRLDGIDNAGVGVHNASATVWKDLSGNGRDAFLAGNADGTSHWTDKGFYFNRNAVFATTAQFQLGKTYTIEGLVDSAKTDYPDSGVNGQVFCNSVNNLRSANSPSYNGWLYYHKNGGKWMFLAGDVTDAVWGAANTTLSDATLSYFTAFRNGPLVSLTNSAALPPSGQWAGSAKDDVPPDDIWCFGANSATAVRSGNQWNFKGTFKSFRAYTRLLTDEELAHNRAVDDARFFGKIPETGCVVVQSAIAGLEGREPNGIYFPDGWTFTAGSATQIVRGIEWQCVGYQLQTWDAATSTWGAQQTVLRNGENVAEYTPSGTSFASVRITWLWKPVKGRRAVRDYAVDDYVVGGAQLHLDGIDNVGVGVHNDSATVWKDLSGNGRDATLTTGGASAWTKDGYSFAGDAYFRTSASFTLGTIYTMQMLVDWNSNKMDGQNRMFLAPQGGTADGTIWWKNQDENIFFRGDNSFGSAWNACPGISNPLTATYLTSLRDGNRAAITTGTAYPKATGTKGSANSIIDWFEGAKNNPASAGNWTVGADYQGNQKISAGVKSVRLYDRMLTEDELAWNRNVDSARYFGELVVTNVVVATKYGDVESDAVEVLAEAPGAYTVVGSWTFSATSVKDKDGILKPVAGYYTEELDASGEWTNKIWHEGETEYPYNCETSPACVRLTWSVPPPGTILILR